MKIVYVTHSSNPRTGAGTLASNIVKGAVASMPGVSVEMLTSENFLQPKKIKFLTHLPKVAKIIRSADVVHALDGFPYGVLADLLTLGTRIPVIVTAVGSGSIQHLYTKGIKAKLLKFAYRKARYVTAISNYVANEIQTQVGVPVSVINPGVDADFWQKRSETVLDTKMKNLQPYLLTQGELKKRKGYEVLLPILASVFKKHPSVHYVIIANVDKNKEYLSTVRALIHSLGIEDKVSFLSNLTVEELRCVYQNARGYILLPQNISGDVEGFGLSIVDAAASGVPAIVGRGSGADDTVLDGKSGFLVSGDNSNEVENRIIQILTDDALHGTLSEGAKEFSRTITWEHQIKKYVELYKKIQG